jgi:plastocyanin
VAVGSTAGYGSLTLSPLPAASSGSQTVTLTSTAPTGLTVTFSSDTVKLTTDAKSNVKMTITSSQSMTPGDYKVKIGGTYGTNSKTADITVRVVQYLVLQQGNNFSPGSLSVKQGSIVYWINMDTPGGGDAEIHNVIFSAGSSAHGPDMALFDTYSFTFTATGNYAYFCSYHPGMGGTVTVTA